MAKEQLSNKLVCFQFDVYLEVRQNLTDFIHTR